MSRKLAELEKREVIRLVTVGSGNSDLELSNYYSNTINVDDNNTAAKPLKILLRIYNLN